MNSKAFNGAVWSILGFGGGTFLRMIGSLILTRIFLPETFGLMAIVSAIIVGLELISDVGVRTSVIQHQDGHRVDFLKTAWSIQVVRGILLYLFLLVAAPHIALLYDEPLLSSILPILGLTMVLKGVTSTSLLVCGKKLLVKKPVVTELLSQLMGLLVTVSLALYLNNIWAFVFGWIVSVLCSVILSYVCFDENVVGLKINRVYFKEIIRFGKWILLSTLATYLVGQGDRLILGLFVSKSNLGLYNLAVMFAALATALFGVLSSRMMLPALAEVNNDQQISHTFSDMFNSLRNKVLKLVLPLLIVMAIFGELLILLLFNENFSNAGWMLQVLAIGGIGQILVGSITPVFLAKGNSYYLMVSNIAYSVCYLAALFIGQHTFSIQGVVIGVSIAPYLVLPFVIALSRKYVVTSVKGNYVTIALSLLLVALGWSIFGINIPSIFE